MLNFLPRWLTKDWLISGHGPTALLLSAIIFLCFNAYMYGLAALHVDVQRVASISSTFRTLTNTFGAVSAAATALLYLAMWFYWVEVDESNGWRKRLWFAVLLVGFFYGSCLYYFLVYRPQVAAFQKGANA